MTPEQTSGDDLPRKYTEALKEINELRKKLRNLSSTTTVTDSVSHSIAGIELLMLRINESDIIEYVNQAFSKFFMVSKEDIIGKNRQILSKLRNQELLGKIQPLEPDVSKTVETMDEFGDRFKIKMTNSRGLLDIIFENVTDHHRLRDYVRKYISSDLTSLSDEDLTTFKFPERRFMTLSFTSLRGFTELSETLIPEYVRKTVNAYLSAAMRAVDMNGATVDKIMGDEIMVLYGAPKYYKDHALRAVKTALEQVAQVKDIQREFQSKGRPMPGCGIGINTGDMVIGSIGSASRKDYTVLGSAVNIAARLGKIAREEEVLLTEKTFKSILSALPAGWEVELKNSDLPNLELLGGAAEGFLPLPSDKGKSITLGPAGSPVIFLKYLYALKIKGVKNPITVLSATILSAPENIELKDDTLKYYDGLRIFGKYHLIKLIAKGGMGEVWKAEDSFGNTVAVKTLLMGDRASEPQLQRFMKEADIMSKLHHRGICRIHEVGEIDQIKYIAMEYVEGVTLSRILEYRIPVSRDDASTDAVTKMLDISEVYKIIEGQESQIRIKDDKAREPVKNYNVFSEEKALNIILKVCDAIQFAHGHGILHRDIKPQNIMICHGDEPVILDFGIAEVKSAKTTIPREAGKGQIFGTIEYMAPEQAASGTDIDERTDVYGIGAILYQMLTGKKQYTSVRNILQDIKHLRKHEPVSPRFYNRKISRDLEAVVLKALKNSKSERYASAQALKEDILRYRNRDAVSALPPTLSYRMRMRLQKHKTAAVLICLLAVLAGGFTGYVLKEKRKQSGQWTSVHDIDFLKPGAETGMFIFRDGLNANTAAPFETVPAGMVLRPYEKCWLKINPGVLYNDNIRVELDFSRRSSASELVFCINAEDSPLSSRTEIPRGYFIHHGAFEGTLDRLGNNIGDKSIHFRKTACSSPGVKRTVTLAFEKMDRRFSCYLNGKGVMDDQDFTIRAKSTYGGILLYSLKDTVYIEAVRVFRQTLPEKSSPLIHGEALESREEFGEAIEAYINIAGDYTGTAVAEEALYKAFIIACQDPARFGKFINPIKDIYRERYPQSPFRVKLLELETVRLWEDGKYEEAFKNLAYIYSADPGSQLIFHMKLEGLAGEPKQRLLKYLGQMRAVGNFEITPGGPWDIEDMRDLMPQRLFIGKLEAEDLSALQGAPIEWLYFPGNRVADIRFLGAAPLTCLFAGFNAIEELGPLTGRPLRFCSLNHNRIRSLAPLQTMPLTSLQLSENQIEDLSPLGGMPLEELDISHNRIISLAPLRGMRLARLDIHHNSIESLEPIGMMLLPELDFRNNQVSDLSPLQDMPAVRILAGGNPVTDIAPIAGMQLNYLDLSTTRIGNLEPLNKMSVSHISLNQNGLASIIPLFSPVLKKLDLDFNSLKSLKPFEKLQLTRLSFAHNNIRSLAPLKGQPLKYLNCQDNRIASLAPFMSSPPDTFLFDNASLSIGILRNAADAWSRIPSQAFNRRYAITVLYLRQKNIPALRKMAKIFQGHRYLHIIRPMTFETAEKTCRRLGGHLATIGSEAENRFLAEVLYTPHPAWIGIIPDNGNWKWVTGEDAEYLNTDFIRPGDETETLLFSGPENDNRWISPDARSEASFIIEWDR